MTFDPIATATVPVAPSREPPFVHDDPTETRSYLIRKLAYLDAFRNGIRDHLLTFRAYPPKRVVGGST